MWGEVLLLLSYFTDKDTEAQEDELIRPRLNEWGGLNLGLFGSYATTHSVTSVVLSFCFHYNPIRQPPPVKKPL